MGFGIGGVGRDGNKKRFADAGGALGELLADFLGAGIRAHLVAEEGEEVAVVGINCGGAIGRWSVRTRIPPVDRRNEGGFELSGGMRHAG